MQTNAKSVEACRELFGAYPEDVICHIHCTAETLSQLEEILKTISKEALVPHNGHCIKRLADAAAHLAFDMGEYAGQQHEIFTERLRTAGVIA